MIKRFLKNFITKHLFKMVTEKDFLQIDQKTGEMYIGKHKLSKGEVEGFAKAAKDLRSNDAYVLIVRELWSIGEKKIFFEGSDHGRDVLWTLDLIIKKAENMSKLIK